MVWGYLLVFVIALAIGAAYKPKTDTRPPAGIDEFKIPTAEVGREIPVLFGTRDIPAPNIVWYGDFESVAVRKKGGKK